MATRRNFLNKGERKNLIYFLLIGFLLSILILTIPVKAIPFDFSPSADYIDPTGTDTLKFCIGDEINTTFFGKSTFTFNETVLSWGDTPDTWMWFVGYCTGAGYQSLAMYPAMPPYYSTADSRIIDNFGGEKYTIWRATNTSQNPPPIGYFTWVVSSDLFYDVDFVGTPVIGDSPLTVTFTDTSLAFTPLYFKWDFGDGNIYEGVESSVQHTYTTTGYYDVKLLNTDFAGKGGWENKTAYIEVSSVVNQTTGGYSFSVTPSTVNYNENFTISLSSISGNFTGVQEVRFGYTQGSASDILYDKDGYILDYTLIGGTWYQYDGISFSINKGANFPNPITLVPANFGSGSFIIDVYLIKTNNQVIHLTEDLTISTNNLQALTIHAIDYNDGYIVSTAHINVLDISHNTWDNRSAGGDKVFYYPYNQKLYIYVNSSTYYDSFKNYTVTSAPTNLVDVVMYRGITTPVGNVTLRVNVMDTSGGYLNNAKVTVLNDESYFDSQSKYTNYAGIAVFIVIPSTDYVISVSKTGYLSSGKLINSGSGGLTLDTTIVLFAGSNPTATPTPLPTTAPGQYTGGIGGGNITPVSCRVTLPQGSTLLDTLRNNMACAGITSGANQGFGIALMIIFVLGIIGGKYGKGMGVVMGMSAGYVLSLAMGLVPLWTFIALLVFICLILAVKIWSSDK